MTTSGTAKDLQAVIGTPSQVVLDKVARRLDRSSRRFIQLCPFLCLGTSSDDGADVSPRGGTPGFVEILDDRTLLIPERPGNRRTDTMRNLIANPAIGMLLLVPGVEEVLRINGRGAWTSDADLLAGARVGIVIDIVDVCFHCSKAVKRGRLWDHDAQIEGSEFPSAAEISTATRARTRDAKLQDGGVLNS